MLSLAKKYLRDKTNKSIAINTSGNYLNVAFTAFFAILLVRVLSVEQYGVLSVLLGISYILANILELGTTATIYSTIPRFEKKDEGGLLRFIKSVFVFQSLFATIIVLVLIFSFPQLDKIFFKTDAPFFDLFLTAIGTLFLIWQNFFTNVLFSAKRFFRANIYINGANIAKLLLILGAWYTESMSISLVLFAFVIVGPLTFLGLVLFKNRRLSSKMGQAHVNWKEISPRYTLTYFIASQFYNLGLRMDLFLLSFFGLRLEVGYYGLSQKIILTILATVISISQVLSPRFSQIINRKQLSHEVKRALRYMCIPTGILIALILTPSWIFNIVFTSNYAPSIPITKLLALPFIISAFGTIPHMYLLYTVKKPSAVLLSNIAFLLVVSLSCFLLIPHIGMVAGPVALTLGFSSAVLIQVLAMMRINMNI